MKSSQGRKQSLKSAVKPPPPVPKPRQQNRPTALPQPSAGLGATDQRRYSRQSRRQSVNGQSLYQLEKRRSIPRPDIPHHARKSTSKRKILIILLLLLLIGVLAGVIAYLWPLLFSDSECDNLDLPPEYRAIICARLETGHDCGFNVEGCEVDCPLGLETDEFACITSCDCATSGLFESDVAYNPTNLQMLLSAYMTIEDHTFQLFSGSASNVLNIWNLYKIGSIVRIPYILNDNLDSNVLAGINSAIATLSNSTCVELTLKTNEPDYIVFKDGLGCSSAVSRIGGEQHITLSKNCNAQGSILHEIMHALGFWHEHSRPDRDEHVKVMWDNIHASNQHHFNTRSIETVFDFGSPYDKSSVMQVSGYSYAEDHSKPSLIDLETDEAVKIQRNTLSAEDIMEINALYECHTSADTATGAQWGEWSALGHCSMTCGPGVAYKVRECLDGDFPVFRRYCGTDYHTQESCNVGPCEEGVWGPWSQCDHTCGLGKRKRISCCGKGSTTEIEDCSIQECSDPAEAFWADWQDWGECLRTCGNGMRRRYRACFDMFDTKIENLRCPQVGTSHLEIEICSSARCPETPPEVGNWGGWSQWGECSRTCGVGSYKRNRECYTMNGTIARYCIGDDMEIEACNMTQCPKPVLALWMPWGPWSDCSETCGGGRREKTRKCQSSETLTLETDCGESMELLDVESRLETCNNEPCDPDRTQWAEWGSWGECSSECQGTRWRLRNCVGGKLGDPGCDWDGIYDKVPCNEDSCDKKGRSLANDPNYKGSRWGAWSQWSECSASCKGGFKKRYRLCETADRIMAHDCIIGNNKTGGSAIDQRKCNTQNCTNPNATWDDWESWQSCTVTCGNGLLKRRRTCLPDRKCVGSRLSSKVCKLTSCDELETKKEKSGIFASGKLSRFFGGGFTEKSPSDTNGMFQGEAWSRKEPSCESASRLYRGDFDGDGNSDKLCLDLKGYIKISYASSPNSRKAFDWEKDTGFCSKVIGLVYAVDFNGDGTADLMCYVKSTGYYTVMFSRDGKFDGTGGFAQGKAPENFCKSHSQVLYVFDDDDDNKADLVCREGQKPDQIIYNRFIV